MNKVQEAVHKHMLVKLREKQDAYRKAETERVVIFIVLLFFFALGLFTIAVGGST